MTRVINYMTAGIFIYISAKKEMTGGKLLLPCEVGVKTVLPAIRALMARAIVEKHGLKEKQAAEILGSSQSAISRYTTRNRGNILSIENVAEVQSLIDQMITFLIHKPEQKIEILKLFCQTCKIIREKGLMCDLCQQNKMHRAWIETCDFCRSP
jgi:predicted transcriptional regulator